MQHKKNSDGRSETREMALQHVRHDPGRYKSSGNIKGFWSGAALLHVSTVPTKEEEVQW